MSVFAERVKEARNAKGLTQDELALKLGYSGKGVISMIETGKRTVTLGKVREIADVLGVAPAYLMGWDGDDADELPALDKQDAKFKRYWNGLNDLGKKRVLDYMRDLSDNEKYKDQ